MKVTFRGWRTYICGLWTIYSELRMEKRVIRDNFRENLKKIKKE